VTTQLLLLDGGQHSRRLDAKTRQLGRQGIEEARRLLAEMRPPEPKEHGRQLSRAS
jgi:signal transduction histidine kinase